MPIRPALLAALAILPAAAPAAAEAADPVVRVAAGALRGVAADGVEAFKGIPYAAPPVGERRWREPAPAAPWAGVRDARGYGADCMQLPFPSDAAPLGTAPAEDCLYANVWRPAGAGVGTRLPVMVWIHGGGFVNGGGSPPTYSGARLARAGIVVVSVNYRLGRFGTFAHPRLPADGGPDYGYRDQLAALRWVRANIAAFGGDPARVTAVGESAGGASVHFLLTSPLAAGLVSGAVIMSGGLPAGGPGPADALAAGLAFAGRHGIADDAGAPARLRALPAASVVDGLNLAAMDTGRPATYTAPVVDGRVMVDAMAAYRAGRFARVPVMVGATSGDIGGPDGVMLAGARAVAATLAGQGVPVWRYRFGYVAAAARGAGDGLAPHASDIPFFLDTADVKYGAATTATDRAAARVASGYLVNFVKRGDPNGPGLPRWPRAGAGGGATLDLTPAGGAAVVP